MTSSNWKVENLGVETRKAHERRVREGFFERYFKGQVLDIGYRGYEDMDVVPVLPEAIGVDLNYPGYDGKRLPFADGTVDTVYNSHTLEHIPEAEEAIREWFRVLKVGGFLVVTVPHQYLYEKRTMLPSRWNMDHKRFYTPSKLLAEVERALPPNSYRVRRLVDDDEDYSYQVPPTQHAGGAYQIELVLEKIQQPAWELEGPKGISAEEANTFRDSLNDLESHLGIVFTDIRESATGLSGEQAKLALRLHGLLTNLAQAAKEGRGLPADPGELALVLQEVFKAQSDLAQRAKAIADYAEEMMK